MLQINTSNACGVRRHKKLRHEKLGGFAIQSQNFENKDLSKNDVSLCQNKILNSVNAR